MQFFSILLLIQISLKFYTLLQLNHIKLQYLKTKILCAIFHFLNNFKMNNQNVEKIYLVILSRIKGIFQNSVPLENLNKSWHPIAEPPTFPKYDFSLLYVQHCLHNGANNEKGVCAK